MNSQMCLYAHEELKSTVRIGVFYREDYNKHFIFSQIAEDTPTDTS